MQTNGRVAQASRFDPALLAKAHSQSQPMKVSDRIKKLLGVTQWSDLLAEGDVPYFGF